MRLEHEFTVPVPVAQAWRVLLDVERVAPCFPGATLTRFDGDELAGTVTVRLGPMHLTYRGTAQIRERDENARQVVVAASGKENRGPGTAKATVTGTLTARGEATGVRVVTDLAITGRPAQLGRGVIEEVGNKLVGRFAEALAAELARPPLPESPAHPAEAVDLLGVAAVPVLRRVLVPAVAALAVALAVLTVRRRLRRQRQRS